jgi:hypothetical protein
LALFEKLDVPGANKPTALSMFGIGVREGLLCEGKRHLTAMDLVLVVARSSFAASPAKEAEIPRPRGQN